jgi:hypothetical protein
MTWKCFFAGCKWNTGLTFWICNELLHQQTCTRCQAVRTVSGAKES